MVSALVTDTHPLIYYFCTNQRKLNAKVRRAFEKALKTKTLAIHVPTVVLWEFSLLVEAGDIKLNQPFTDWVEALFQYQMFIEEPFDHKTVIEQHDLRFTDDPFDRAIVATAVQLDLPLITNDQLIHRAKPCKLFWD